jgi:hypothetical protein
MVAHDIAGVQFLDRQGGGKRRGEGNTPKINFASPKLCPSFGRTLGDGAVIGRLPAAMGCLSFLLVTAAPLYALARDERPVPPLPIDARQAAARDHARALSEMADTAARDSAKCQSSGAALGSKTYKECRALLEDKMSIENDVPSDRSYASTRGR